MDLDTPVPGLYKITCIAADAKRCPQYLKIGGKYQKNNQRIVASLHSFDSIEKALHGDGRRVYVPEPVHDEEPDTVYVCTSVNNESFADIRMLLDRFFEIPTETCIAIERLIPYRGEIFIG